MKKLILMLTLASVALVAVGCGSSDSKEGAAPTTPAAPGKEPAASQAMADPLPPLKR